MNPYDEIRRLRLLVKRLMEDPDHLRTEVGDLKKQLARCDRAAADPTAGRLLRHLPVLSPRHALSNLLLRLCPRLFCLRLRPTCGPNPGIVPGPLL